MDTRQQRGLVIAATCKLTQKGKVWVVPSQKGSGRYTVCPDHDAPYCSCPDHEETGLPCKHVYAVRTVMMRECHGDGTVTETREVTFTEKRTYKQDWPMYNVAQREEKRRLLVLLDDLCKGVVDPPSNKCGRKRRPMRDMVFSTVYKVYSGFSARRFGSDLDDAHDRGYITRPLNPLLVCAFLDDELLTPVLIDLIVQSSLPLRALETTFAPDSTGFSTSRFVRWFDEKYGRERSGKDWVKAHAICGTTTNVITAVEIAGRDAGDCPMFRPLIEKTAENFNVKEVTADKAYLSYDNLALVERLGGTAFIPFKVNSTPGAAGSLWQKLYHFYSLNRDEFLRHYHQRSNVETTFSMVKAKFGDSVRARTDVAMKNEVLCKILCHNLCVLIQSQIELGIEGRFWEDEGKEQIILRMPLRG